MVLDDGPLDTFGLDTIPGKKRNKVRKGLKTCEVSMIEDLGVDLERMRVINIAQARRLEKLGESGTFLPSVHYTEHADQWRKETQQLFTHRSMTWWGARHEGRLAAYVVTLDVDGTRVIGAVKSDPEMLRYRPVDAIYFQVLASASRHPGILRVVNGGPDGERPSLTRFKEQFLFVARDVPYYSSRGSILRLLKWFRHSKHKKSIAGER
jgi:hypothetical protein